MARLFAVFRVGEHHAVITIGDWRELLAREEEKIVRILANVTDGFLTSPL